MSIFKKCIECDAFKDVALFVPKTNCCKLCKSVYTKDYRKKNKQRLAKLRISYSKNYYVENKERLKPIRRAWKSNNLDKSAGYRSKRRALQLKATPSWINENAIESLYALSSFLTLTTFGNGYHVDHIIPLNNDLVCGLHTENNLQILRAEDNLSKSNQFWPDMW